MIKQINQKKIMPKLCLLTLLLCHLTNADVNTGDQSSGVCMAEQDSPSCSPPPNVEGTGNMKPSSHLHSDESAESDSLLHRGMQGLEAVLDKMATSSDQMMHDMIDKMSESRAKMMAGLDSMMDRMSESRTKVMKGLDAMMEKMAKTKEEMKEGFDNVIDQVSHSKMMEEIDLVLESIKQSKVMMEIRALPEEIRQSFILSARNRSYIFAGVLVSITSAILFGGAIYYAWCHHDAWSYYIGTIDEAKALLNQYKESGLLSRSRTSSEDDTDGSGSKKTNGEAPSKEIEDLKNCLAKDNKGMELCDDADLKQLKNGNVETNTHCGDFMPEEDDDVFEDLTPAKHMQNGNHPQQKGIDVTRAGDEKQGHQNQTSQRND